jgi:hypothetical protein
MPGRPLIERPRPEGGVLGDVRGDPVSAQRVHESSGVVPLVGPEGPMRAAGQRPHHRHGRVPLGRACRVRHAGLDGQRMTIVHQDVAVIGELGGVAGTLLGQPGLGVHGRRVGGVRASFPAKIHRGIAGIIGRGRGGGRLRFEALVAGPRLDQGGIDREVLGRQQGARSGLV